MDKLNCRDRNLVKRNLSVQHCSSVKWGHLGHFDLEPNKRNFPTNPMGSSATHWARLYNNNYKNQNKN